MPALAGVCPACPPRARGRRPPRAGTPVPGAAAVPPIVQAFIDRFVAYMDNGVAPRWPHAFGHEARKLGVVNHIPVCDTLEQLTTYFNGGSAKGSTHFGIGRETAGTVAANGREVPFATVHQYMPIVGPCSPWAQGLIQTSDQCSWPPTPAIQGMRQGEPNGAFVSIENVARSGRDGLTDVQFNSNAMLRAYCAAYFGFPINPLTQLWHCEIDQKDRCFDPGWSGELEDAMQAAATRLLQGDLSGLRGAAAPVVPRPTPTPRPAPPPEPTPVVDYKALYVAELRGELAAVREDGMRAAVREKEILSKLEKLGVRP